MKSEGNAPAPMTLAIMICDATIRDADTGKISVINSFNHIHASKFPCVHPTMTVFLAITDVIGKTNLRLDLVRGADDGLDDESIFSTGDLPVESQDPRMVYEIPIRLNAASFPRPGVYRFHLYANGEYLIGRRFFVTGDGEDEPDSTAGEPPAFD